MTKHYVNQTGNYLGGYGTGAIPPDGAIPVPSPPPVHASQIWDGTRWGPPVVPLNSASVRPELKRNPAFRALVLAYASARGLTYDQFVTILDQKADT